MDFYFPEIGLLVVLCFPMTVSSRSIGVHFLDEQTLANLSRIMFAQKSASANAAEALLKNNTKETPVSFEKILSTISIHFFVILGGSLWLTPFKLLVGIHDPLGTAFASIRAHHRSGVRIIIIQRLFQ